MKNASDSGAPRTLTLLSPVLCCYCSLCLHVFLLLPLSLFLCLFLALPFFFCLFLHLSHPTSLISCFILQNPNPSFQGLYKAPLLCYPKQIIPLFVPLAHTGSSLGNLFYFYKVKSIYLKFSSPAALCGHLKLCRHLNPAPTIKSYSAKRNPSLSKNQHSDLLFPLFFCL